MLKRRPAGDKSWPIACSHTKLGKRKKELDLSGAHLSYGDFKDATFRAKGVIRLNGAGLANADLSGTTLTADGTSGAATIDFAKANLADADLSGATLIADLASYGAATINFAEANLANADLSGATLTAEAGGSYSGDLDDAATINFAEANLANADLSGSGAHCHRRQRLHHQLR